MRKIPYNEKRRNKCNYIEEIEQFISMLTDDIESGEGTIITQTKLAVYREVLEHLEEIEREPSGDLISREGTLTAFANYVGSGMSMNDYDALWDIVANMPAVKQEPKFMAKSDGTIEQIINCNDCLFKKEWEKIGKLLSNILEKHTEQEPCEDCISRTEVIKSIDEREDVNGKVDAESVRTDIVLMQPVNPTKTGHWIPVSERLPEEYGEYLITWTTSQSKRPFIGISEGEVTSEYDHEHNRFKFEWLLEDYVKNYPDVKVIAWMPLPEPYQPQESEEI